MPVPPLRKRLAMVLNSLPSYAEIDLVSEPYEGRIDTFRLMARDRPTYDTAAPRRFTNLTTGTEWFVTAEMLEQVGVTSVEIHLDEVKNWSVQ